MVILLALVACQSNQRVRSTPPPVLTQVTPTAAIASPTEASPPPVVSAQMPLLTYTHPSGRFKLAYPQGWQPFEQANGVVFIASKNQAGYSVIFNDVGEIYNAEALNQYLVTFVAQNFAGEGSNFTAISQEQRQDGSVVAQFSSADPHLGQAISQITVLQKDTVLFVVHIGAPEAQWKVSAEALQALAEQVVISEEQPAPASEPAATEEPPVWALIGPRSNEFGFLYPSNWLIVEQEDHLISVAQPENKMSFTATNFLWTDRSQEVQAATKAAQDYLESLSGEVEKVQNLPATEFPLDRVQGATIDFLYVAEDGTQMAGSIITGLANGKMHRIVFTAPAEFYEGALQWFNPMYQSFKILAPEELIRESP